MNENLNVFSKIMFDLLRNFAKSQNHTTNIVKEVTEIRQKRLIGEHMTEMNDRTTQ